MSRYALITLLNIFKQFSQNTTSNIHLLKWATSFGMLYHHQALFYKVCRAVVKRQNAKIQYLYNCLIILLWDPIYYE